MKPGVSVVICCYNSGKRLPETLRYLSIQKLNGSFPVELIIVDNNSSDETGTTAAEIWKSYNHPFPIRIVSEPNAGLSYARQKGFDSAQYSYVLLCDDDNWLEENYILRAFSIMEKDAGVGALGGVGFPAFEIQAPPWFEMAKGGYAVGEQADETGDVTETRGFLWGAGMIIRMEALEKLKIIRYKSILTDRKGSTITSGGDGELCSAIRLLGYRLFYNTDLEFRHYMTKERLTWPYYLKLVKSFGQARVYLGFYDYVIARKAQRTDLTPRQYWTNAWRDCMKGMKKSLKGIVRLKFFNNEGQFNLINAQLVLGRFTEMVKIMRTYKRHILQIDSTFRDML